jgi:hypothetical protein
MQPPENAAVRTTEKRSPQIHIGKLRRNRWTVESLQKHQFAVGFSASRRQRGSDAKGRNKNVRKEKPLAYIVYDDGQTRTTSSQKTHRQNLFYAASKDLTIATGV